MRKQTKLWTTGAGKKVRICDMTPTHLVNAIRHLERFAQASYEKTLADAYATANMLTGDMALASIEDAIDYLEDLDGRKEEEHAHIEDFAPPILLNLRNDAERRNISIKE